MAMAWICKTCANFYKMTALFQKIIFITGLFTSNAFSKGSEPYLTIMVNNLPLLTNTIEVSYGQNVYVDCIAHPSHYSALWLPKGKYSKQADTQVIDESILSNIASLNLTDLDIGIYICQSIPTKLEKSIKVVAKKRIRRDDGSFDFSFPEGRLPTFAETLELQKKMLEIAAEDDIKQQQRRDEEERQRVAELNRLVEQIRETKKPEGVNRIVGITVGVLAIGGVLIAILCVLCRNSMRKLPTPIAATSVPTRTTAEQLRPLNSQTAQSPYRPTETHYPPTSIAVRPTAPTAVEPETPPPPSYTEAVNNVKPTAPTISI